MLSFVQGTEFKPLNKAWVVLSDNQTNFQYSHAGRQYWTNIDPLGLAFLKKVVPGTYRLSAYVLGEWGELRLDNVNTTAGNQTFLPLKFTPENFGSAPPIWTIGTPDRSSHEFLHGRIHNPIDLDRDFVNRYTLELGNATQDDREYWGNWNYWQDFAANAGAVNYYATPVGSTPAKGVMYDALRMEITNKSAAHEVTGWNDYEYLYGTTYEPANDSLPNNNF